MNFLHHGIPKIKRDAKSINIKEENVNIDEELDFLDILRKIIQHPTVACKEWIIRQYDHEVQANTIIKPLQGENLDGHGDACVIKPLHDSWQGFIVSNGFNPNYSLNPRKMALSSIDEAIRNNICCGGRRFALLDNFSWGNPEKEENLGALVEACKACYDYAVILGTPFISGKDSLYNDFQTEKGKIISIPHTLLITCVGLIPDVRKSVTSDFKQEDNYIYLVGNTKNELGGSLYHKMKNITGGIVPDVDLKNSKVIFDKMIESIDKGLIRSCHDCSEGGLIITLSEMCFAGNLGAEIDLRSFNSKLNKNYQILFSESNSRFLVEVNDGKAFEKLLEDVPIQKLGKISGNRIIVKGIDGKKIIDENVQKFKELWKITFNW
jgi:phosphoribosylformylglycinamidine (FGAM) synthase-like enzyme